MRDPPGEAEQGWGVEGDSGLEARQGDEKGKMGTLDSRDGHQSRIRQLWAATEDEFSKEGPQEAKGGDLASVEDLEKAKLTEVF